MFDVCALLYYLGRRTFIIPIIDDKLHLVGTFNRPMYEILNGFSKSEKNY